MNPLIVERIHRGHRLMYVALLIRGARDRGGRATVLLTPDAPGSVEYATHLGPLAGDFDLITADAISASSIILAARKHRSDTIVVPDADTLLTSFFRLAWRRLPARLALLVMRPDSHGGARSTVVTLIKRAIVGALRRHPKVDVFTLASSTRKPTRNEVSDPAVVDVNSRDLDGFTVLAGLDDDHFWFGVIGAITGRKNVDLVLGALGELDPETSGLLIAGKISDDIRDDLLPVIDAATSMGLTVRVVDDFLENTQIDAAVAAVDCVILAHSNEGSSGILSKATRTGTRILAAGARSLRDDVGRIGDGARWCELDVDDIVSAMRLMQTDPTPKPLSPDGALDFTTKLLGS
ncbi:glycosyltransferase [Hoyosella rhizosphaerae]|uniref:Glycosyltransferase n=1 Tax=Hoyosella rhizosphaerae TaxID=1755582 RepID=A0A916UC36_9ACTN|nr:glycosyltransferase [Hoyosella rhizosphaerae]MBN4925893.1 glycosyltransferase [Hoyosella rhizosphaerae]GGC67136.1 hypothetical protein GCM10011410_19750 [Hoyosella rhizosphaerae]